MNAFDTIDLPFAGDFIDFAVLSHPNGSKLVSRGSDSAAKGTRDFGILVAPPGVGEPESVDLLKDPTPAAPEGFWENAADFFKSVPSGAADGLLTASNQPPHWAFPQDIYDLDIRPLREEGKRNLLKQMYSPRGPAGRYGYAGGEAMGNPYSYVGPGRLPFKIGSTIVSSAASEAAGQATEGTNWELPARVGGALFGAYTYGKAAGPRAPKAALPTAAELHVASDVGIDAIRSSNLALKPDVVTSWAKATSRELKGAKFTPGQHGSAPETNRILGDIYFPPGISVWPDQFESIKQNLQRVASRGAPRDAEAASIALQRLKEFTENVPQGAVLRGDAGNYVRVMEAARADRAAAERLQRLDPRLTKAESAADKQPAGSVEAQIRAKAGAILDDHKKLGGLSKEEIALLEQQR